MSQDEMSIRVVIDPSQFREELGRLRRDLEDQNRIEMDKLRGDVSHPPQTPTVVEIRERVTGYGDEGRMKQYIDEQIALVRRERGLRPEESRVTPDMLIERFTAAIGSQQAGQRWAYVPGEKDVLTPEAARVMNVLNSIKERFGGSTANVIIRDTSVSTSAAIREILNLIDKFSLDTVEGDRFGSPGEIKTLERRIVSAYARDSGGGEGLMHKGLKNFVIEMSEIVKEGRVETGTEVGTETGGRLDASMITAITDYFGEIKTDTAGADARRQLVEYVKSGAYRRFISETGRTGGVPGAGTPERVRFDEAAVAWAERVGPERIAARRRGENIPKSIKGILLAPHITGNLYTELMQDLRESKLTGPLVGLPGGEDIAELDITLAQVPKEAIDYVTGMMREMRAAGETPDESDWQRFFMEWVAGNKGHSFSKAVIKGVNLLEIPPEQLEAELDARLGNYYENEKRLAEAGEPSTPQQLRTGVGKILRGGVGYGGATRTDIRDIFLGGRVPIGVTRPRPRIGRVTDAITRGATYIADFMATAISGQQARAEQDQVSQLVGGGTRAMSQIEGRASAGEDWAIFTRALFADYPDAISGQLRLIITENQLEWGDYGTAMQIFEREMRERYDRTPLEEKTRLMGSGGWTATPQEALQIAYSSYVGVSEDQGTLRLLEEGRDAGEMTQEEFEEAVHLIVEGPASPLAAADILLKDRRMRFIEQERLSLFRTTGIGMEFDPKEHLAGMKKVAAGLGFKGAKGWKAFEGLIEAKREGKLGEHLKETIGSVMAVVGATLKGGEEAGVFSKEQQESLSKLMAGTPQFWELYQKTPRIDPDTGKPEAIGTEAFYKLVRETVSPTDLPSIGKELNKMLKNPEINAMLNPENLSSLHRAAISVKRMEQATMDLEPAFGGSLRYWT